MCRNDVPLPKGFCNVPQCATHKKVAALEYKSSKPMPLVFSFRSPNRPLFECAVECQQCTAVSASGAQCKKRACIGVPKCWMHLLRDHSLRIKPSTIPGAGKGLFAMKRGAAANAVVFKKDAKIIDYYGDLVNRQTLDARYGDHTAPYGIQIGTGNRYEDAACRRGVGAVANHRGAGYNARLSYRWQPTPAALVKAIRPIRNGQEVLVSYGQGYLMDEAGVTHKTIRKRAAP